VVEKLPFIWKRESKTSFCTRRSHHIIKRNKSKEKLKTFQKNSKKEILCRKKQKIHSNFLSKRNPFFEDFINVS
jgi:hypothetical protein